MSTSVPAWIPPVARAGYVAKGVVYTLVGGLATWTAFTTASQVEGSKGALATLRDEPMGNLLLLLLSAGLLAYAAWRAVQAIMDPEGTDDTDLTDHVQRTYAAISAVLHGALALYAFRLTDFAGRAGGSDSGGLETRASSILSQPFGRWILGAIGVAVVGVGIRQFYRSAKKSFQDKLQLARLSERARTVLVCGAQIALASRGVVFSAIGTLLIVAAVKSNPDAAAGTQGALQFFREQQFVPYLFVVVATGLLLYGLYQFAKARFRKIPA